MSRRARAPSRLADDGGARMKEGPLPSPARIRRSGPAIGANEPFPVRLNRQDARIQAKESRSQSWPGNQNQSGAEPFSRSGNHKSPDWPRR
jgi:hypothetical protein